MAEAAKTLHTERSSSKFEQVSAQRRQESSRPLKPRMELKLEAVQAILDDVAQIDPRAKKFKPQELYDRRYLDERDKSGFLAKLWAGRLRDEQVQR